MKYVVCFDIVNDKKRRKVGEYLEEFGIRVQRSVFEIEISKSKLKNLLKILNEIIEKEDSIRFYQMQSDTINRSIFLGFGDEGFMCDEIIFF